MKTDGTNSARHIARTLTHSDLPGIRSVIDATGLFPSAMLDEMTAGFLDGTAPDEIWLTTGDAVVYCALERMTAGTWNMFLLAVHPEQQRNGVGAMLVAEVEKCVRSHDGHLLLVETSGLPEFDGTRRFYSSQGYGEEARIRDFYRSGEDKVVFRKSLI